MWGSSTYYNNKNDNNKVDEILTPLTPKCVHFFYRIIVKRKFTVTGRRIVVDIKGFDRWTPFFKKSPFFKLFGLTFLHITSTDVSLIRQLLTVMIFKNDLTVQERSWSSRDYSCNNYLLEAFHNDLLLQSMLRGFVNVEFYTKGLIN